MLGIQSLIMSGEPGLLAASEAVTNVKDLATNSSGVGLYSDPDVTSGRPLPSLLLVIRYGDVTFFNTNHL